MALAEVLANGLETPPAEVLGLSDTSEEESDEVLREVEVASEASEDTPLPVKTTRILWSLLIPYDREGIISTSVALRKGV